jgi:hypothetical protein
VKFEDLLRESHWCCPWAFFAANRKIRTGLLASRLGVSEQTVQDWRGFYNRKQIKCKDSRDCMKAAGVNFKDS